MTKKMFLMCGCSGAGKTTFAKKYAEEHNLRYLGVDKFYEKVNGDECLHINMFEVWIEFFKAIHAAEEEGVSVIIDTNAITRCHREQFLEWFPTFEHHLIYIQAGPALRMVNNLSRRRQVPVDAMDRMTMALQTPFDGTESLGWKTIQVVKNENNIFAEPVFWRGEEYMTME